MKSAKNLASLNNNGQNSMENHASYDVQTGNDGTMALVYPDGRVTNVKVRQRKACS